MSSASHVSYSVAGDRYTFLTTAADTEGAYAVIDSLVPAGNGPPPHVHEREDEAFYVIEGDFEFNVGGEVKRVSKGEFLFAPRGVPHNFRNAGTTEGKMILTITPGGFENFFAEVGTKLDSANDPPVPPSPEDIEKLVKTSSQYGVTILG